MSASGLRVCSLDPLHQLFDRDAQGGGDARREPVRDVRAAAALQHRDERAATTGAPRELALAHVAAQDPQPRAEGGFGFRLAFHRSFSPVAYRDKIIIHQSEWRSTTEG